MPITYQTKDQVSVPTITAAPKITLSGAQSAGTSYTVTEQQMLQAAYDAHRVTSTIK